MTTWQLQEWIHTLEEGKGRSYLRAAVFGILILFVALVYDIRAWHNFSAAGAMDSAQLARNIAKGKGYTTLVVRPFSLYLLQRHSRAAAGGTAANAGTVQSQNGTPHPDITNPPVYPLILAGLMKVLPFHYPVDAKSAFWSNNGNFWRYQPDFLIALFNELLLFLVVVQTFFLARKLFDSNAAWLSAILVAGCEMLWRFSVSGLPTMLLMNIFIGLTWCVLLIEEASRDPKKPQFGRLLGLAMVAGLVAGIGALTRYAFGWVIVPLVVFLAVYGGPRRMLCVAASLGVFLLVLSPWVVRNMKLSGTPFGTAGYAVLEGTPAFPDFQLERSIHPDLSSALSPSLYIHKLFRNLGSILQDTLPRLGGTWAGMLFFSGLLLTFRSPAARRVRYFLLACLMTFVVVQALGQTHPPTLPSQINTENLLVLFTPVIFIYGVSLFLTLLDQIQIALPPLARDYLLKSAFAGLCCLPMLFTLLSLSSPVVFPPYYPPDMQAIADWMKPNELTMSDVPWAVAWYGQRQCVWLTLNSQDDFSAVTNDLQPVRGIYLTPKTMNSELASDCMDQHGWGSFALQAASESRIPTGFPLNQMPRGFLPQRLFLSDRDRWNNSQITSGSTPQVSDAGLEQPDLPASLIPDIKRLNNRFKH